MYILISICTYCEEPLLTSVILLTLLFDLSKRLLGQSDAHVGNICADPPSAKCDSLLFQYRLRSGPSLIPQKFFSAHACFAWGARQAALTAIIPAA